MKVSIILIYVSEKVYKFSSDNISREYPIYMYKKSYF